MKRTIGVSTLIGLTLLALLAWTNAPSSNGGKSGLMQPPFEEACQCEYFVPFGNVFMFYNIPNVGNTRFDFRPKHTMADTPPKWGTAHYVNSTGLSDPAQAPNKEIWIAEGQYKCECGCFLGLPTVRGLGLNPNQSTVKKLRDAPVEEEDRRDDYSESGGDCDGVPCTGGPGGGGSSGGNGTNGYTFGFDMPAAAGGWHLVCDMIDWYTNGNYDYTQVVDCWEEWHEPHN